MKTKLEPFKLHKKPWDNSFWKGKLEDFTSPRGQTLCAKLKKARSSRLLIEVPQRKDSKQTMHSPILLGRSPTIEVNNPFESENRLISETVRNLPRKHSDKNSIFGLRQELKPEGDQSLLSQLRNSIEIRELSLNSLKDMNSYLEKTKDWVYIKKVRVQCAKLLYAHRILTLNTLELIQKWMEEYTDKCLWKQENYLLKMLSDLDFLQNSAMASAFVFKKEDPFLVESSKCVSRKGPYYEEDDRYYVPIPTVLTSKITNAEQVLRNERINQIREMFLLTHMKPTGDLETITIAELIQTGILDSLSEPFIRKYLKKALKYYTKNSSELVFENLIHTYSKEMIYGELHASFIERLLKNSKNYSQNDLAEIEEEIEKCLGSPRRLLNHQISEIIYRNLVETVIDEIELDLISEGTVIGSLHRKRSMSKDLLEQYSLIGKEKEILTSKLAKTVFNETLASFVNEIWLEELVQFVYESENAMRNSFSVEVVDYALEMFTPNVHSPISYSILEDQTNTIAQTPKLDFNFNLSSCSPTVAYTFKPAKIPREHFSQVITDYYILLPPDIKSVLIDIPRLQTELQKANDPSWFWAVIDQQIAGALIYSVDPYELSHRKIIVSHISCLSTVLFKDFIKQACEFLWKKDSCDEIRVHLQCQKNKEIHRTTRSYFTDLNFKWKTQRTSASCNDTIMGGSRPPFVFSLSAHSKPTKIRFVSVLHLGQSSEDSPSSKKYQYMAGSRVNMAYALLPLDKKHETSQKSNLQSQLDKTMIDLSSVNLSFCETKTAVGTTEVSEILGKLGINLDVRSDFSKAVSAMNFKFNWVGCSSIRTLIFDIPYKSLHFHSVRLNRCASFEVFTVPTSLENIYGLFVRGKDLSSHIADSDLYSQVVDVINLCDEAFDCSFIAVPAFRVNLNGCVSWVKRFQLNDHYVQAGQEAIRVDMDPASQTEGIFAEKLTKRELFNQDFVFGLINTQISNLPLFAVLIQRKDWIVSY